MKAELHQPDDHAAVEPDAGVVDALAPVRRALLDAARREADSLLAEADARAGSEVAAAEQRAEAIRATAREQGSADARELLGAEEVRARREVRAQLLATQRAAYEDLRQRAVAAVAALQQDPSFPGVRRAFEARARAALGPEAVLTEDPAGGFVARSGARRVVFTLPALVDAVLECGEVDVEGLWRP